MATTGAFDTVSSKQRGKRRGQLVERFRAAGGFLVGLEVFCVTNPRFHLATTRNVHIYLDDRFVLYVVMDRLEASRPVLRLSPDPNVLIKEGTRPDPTALLPKPVEGIISKHRGFSSKWATKKGDSFDIVPGAPEAFFAEVLDLVRGLGGADRVGSGGAPLVTR